MKILRFTQNVTRQIPETVPLEGIDPDGKTISWTEPKMVEKTAPENLEINCNQKSDVFGELCKTLLEIPPEATVEIVDVESQLVSPFGDVDTLRAMTVETLIQQIAQLP